MARSRSTSLDFLALLVVIALWGCGQEPCRESSCPEGTHCELSGTCRASDPALRFTRAATLPVRDWAVAARGGAYEDGDELVLGGPARAVIYFALDVPDDTVVSAVLTLAPHPQRRATGERIRLTANRVERFRGADVTRANAPAREGQASTNTTLVFPPRRPLRVDVTPLLRDAQERGDVHLHFAVHARSDSTLAFSSPRSMTPEARPRVEVRLR